MCRYAQTDTLAVDEKSRGVKGPVPLDRGLGAWRFRLRPRKHPDDQTLAVAELLAFSARVDQGVRVNIPQMEFNSPIGLHHEVAMRA